MFRSSPTFFTFPNTFRYFLTFLDLSQQFYIFPNILDLSPRFWILPNMCRFPPACWILSPISLLGPTKMTLGRWTFLVPKIVNFSTLWDFGKVEFWNDPGILNPKKSPMSWCWWKSRGRYAISPIREGGGLPFWLKAALLHMIPTFPWSHWAMGDPNGPRVAPMVLLGPQLEPLGFNVVPFLILFWYHFGLNSAP